MVHLWVLFSYAHSWPMHWFIWLHIFSFAILLNSYSSLFLSHQLQLNLWSIKSACKFHSYVSEFIIHIVKRVLSPLWQAPISFIDSSDIDITMAGSLQAFSVAQVCGLKTMLRLFIYAQFTSLCNNGAEGSHPAPR